MPKHLKTHIISRLDPAISFFVPSSRVSALHSRGVRYFVPMEGIDAFWGAMNTFKEGRRYHKHIVVRRTPAPLRVRDHAAEKEKPGRAGLARNLEWWAVRVSNPGPWD